MKNNIELDTFAIKELELIRLLRDKSVYMI